MEREMPQMGGQGMPFEPPAQLFSTTLYDRYQPQSLSFIVVPKSSLKNATDLDVNQVWNLLGPDVSPPKDISAHHLPLALASLLSPVLSPMQLPGDPFAWVDALHHSGSPVTIHPNHLGFAEYVSFAEVIPFAESPLEGKSLMSTAVESAIMAGVKAGVTVGGTAAAGIAATGGPTALIFLYGALGIVVCTTAAVTAAAIGVGIITYLGWGGQTAS
jgi:hypothetical protein